tara:strand:- start:923 stop:1318 length:396 start_codon:yes stop_codon:yes gene_type:complete
VTDEDIKAIFGSVEVILNFSTHLKLRLEERMEVSVTATPPPCHCPTDLVPNWWDSCSICLLNLFSLAIFSSVVFLSTLNIFWYLVIVIIKNDLCFYSFVQQWKTLPPGKQMMADIFLEMASYSKVRISDMI